MVRRKCRTLVILKTVLLRMAVCETQIALVFVLQTVQPLRATAALGSSIVQILDLPIEHPEICVLFRVRLE